MAVQPQISRHPQPCLCLPGLRCHVCSQTYSQDQAQTSGILYLQLYYTLVVVLLKALFIRSEMVFDEYTADFERILSLTDRFLNDPRITTIPLLSFDMGVIPPLLFLLLKC